MKISYAPDAWRLLNGVFCVYKPSELNMLQVVNTVILNLCRDLNSMTVRPSRRLVNIRGSYEEGNLTVTNVPNLADDPLVVGPRYQPQDFRLNWVTNLKTNTSGVAVLGINDGCRLVSKMRRGNFLRKYELSGEFGYATDTYHANGKVMEKTTYDHVQTIHVDRLLAAWQASHQKHMFQFAGVDPQSQEAYELAAAGPVRPANESTTMIYGLKCKTFALPHFTLDVQCINENELYLMKIIHELGLTLKSTAVCSKVRQVQFGPFTMEFALLRKHWTLEHIVNNIIRCEPFIKYRMLQPNTPHLTQMEIAGQDQMSRNKLAIDRE